MFLVTMPPTKRKKAAGRTALKLRPEQSQEVAAVVLLALGVLTGLAMAGQAGVAGAAVAGALRWGLGLLAAGLPALLLALAAGAFFGGKAKKAGTGTGMSAARDLGVILGVAGVAGAVHAATVPPSQFFVPGIGGGMLGAAAAALPRHFLGEVASVVALGFVGLLGVVLALPFSLRAAVGGAFRGACRLFTRPAVAPKTGGKKPQKFEIANAKEKASSPEKKDIPASALAPKPAAPGTWEPPPADLFEQGEEDQFDRAGLQKQAERIQEKLREFGVGSSLGPVSVGPTVVRFTLRPEEGVKVAKISNLKNDLRLALAAKSVRVEAPIPGQDLVGIEVPRAERETVRLRELITSSAFKATKSPLPLAVGRDVAGKPICADLADMPHLLIAGATGSGKSVGMNTFLASLLFRHSPAQLRLVLIDPKRVELAPFEGIPHLLTPVITDAEKALRALRWAVAEMMRRYAELSEARCRNLEEFNAKKRKEKQEEMPRIVLVVDELADLMMRQFRKETEAAVCRIAQMARAVGMHLIVATQRPSVDVITGLIKANIPTRIAFAVTSSIDSRTIIDSVGAEDLLGKGDMLFSMSALGAARRVQGVYLSTEEVNRLVNFLKAHGGSAQYDDAITEGEDGGSSSANASFVGGSGGGGDETERAIEVIRESGKASASLLQRRLSVGYARAARILDELEERGMIGPARGAKPREIFL